MQWSNPPAPTEANAQRQGATGNACVVGELCADLEQRGWIFSSRGCSVLDGAKALNVAVKKRAGEAALLQRCQLHKRRNVLKPPARRTAALHRTEVDRGLEHGGVCRSAARAHTAQRLAREASSPNEKKEGLSLDNSGRGPRAVVRTGTGQRRGHPSCRSHLPIFIFVI